MPAKCMSVHPYLFVLFVGFKELITKISGCESLGGWLCGFQTARNKTLFQPPPKSETLESLWSPECPKGYRNLPLDDPVLILSTLVTGFQGPREGTIVVSRSPGKSTSGVLPGCAGPAWPSDPQDRSQRGR